MASANFLFSCVFLVISSLCWSGIHGNSDGKVSEEDLKLEYVQLLWRHGDRSPVIIYPNDPNALFWPQGEGMLTQKGMQQHYALGEYLRSRLGSQFVSQHYLRNETYIVSSHVDRTIESAASNLASFYKPTDWQVFNAQLPWQPVPVHTIPESQDHMLDPIYTECPKWVAIDKQFQKTPEFQAVNASNQDLFAFLTSKTGMTVDVENTGLIYDNFICTKAHNLTMPDWATPEIEKNASVVGNFVFFNFFRTKQQQRLLGGSLLKSIRDAFQSVVEGKRDSLTAKKLIMYSGHDTTIMALTSLLNVFNQIRVPYATTVIMELFSDSNNKFYFKMSYRNDSTHEPYVLDLEVCNYQSLCDWDVFYANTANLILDYWNLECRTHDHGKLHSADHETEHVTRFFLLGVIFVLVIGVMFLILELYCWYLKQRVIDPDRLKLDIEFATASDVNLHSTSVYTY